MTSAHGACVTGPELAGSVQGSDDVPAACMPCKASTHGTLTGTGMGRLYPALSSQSTARRVCTPYSRPGLCRQQSAPKHQAHQLSSSSRATRSAMRCLRAFQPPHPLRAGPPAPAGQRSSWRPCSCTSSCQVAASSSAAAACCASAAPFRSHALPRCDEALHRHHATVPAQFEWGSASDRSANHQRRSRNGSAQHAGRTCQTTGSCSGLHVHPGTCSCIARGASGAHLRVAACAVQASAQACTVSHALRVPCMKACSGAQSVRSWLGAAALLPQAHLQVAVEQRLVGLQAWRQELVLPAGVGHALQLGHAWAAAAGCTIGLSVHPTACQAGSTACLRLQGSPGGCDWPAWPRSAVAGRAACWQSLGGQSCLAYLQRRTQGMPSQALAVCSPSIGQAWQWCL